MRNSNLELKLEELEADVNGLRYEISILKDSISALRSARKECKPKEINIYKCAKVINQLQNRLGNGTEASTILYDFVKREGLETDEIKFILNYFKELGYGAGLLDIYGNSTVAQTAIKIWIN